VSSAPDGSIGAQPETVPTYRTDLAAERKGNEGGS